MSFVTSIRRVIAYYLTGILVMTMVHIFIGWENKILMPRSFLVLIFLWLVALPWSFINISNLFCASKRSQNLHELFIHGLFFLVIAGILVRS